MLYREVHQGVEAVPGRQVRPRPAACRKEHAAGVLLQRLAVLEGLQGRCRCHQGRLHACLLVP
ncbi:MAG: hypothetical protein MZW92_58165 [Comamonadaceae bacterium]|nr:hypothetical protein [Comamonadaceae bacterium]